MEGYVSRDNIRLIRSIFEGMIPRVREDMHDEGISFNCNLVGSAKRNLVIQHPTKGIDCDYQIIIQKNKKNLTPQRIKELFRLSFNKHRPYGLSPCENSTSALTIKQKDETHSRVVFSFDIAIIKIRNGIYEIIRRTSGNNFTWNQLRDMAGFYERYNLISDSRMWNDLRTRYYEKKIKQMNGDDSRKSFQLLNEAVNETLQFFGQ